ncbi:MAG TPA: hypothetical protein EYH34_14110 [Planctomycetes bacterium]|nr:hypothetical protein [Planctomycetota bacterium]
MRKRSGVLWVIGGLALGMGIALGIGGLVFWAWPEFRKARSPLGEIQSGQVVVRYLKESPLAAEIRIIAPQVEAAWKETLACLTIEPGELPERVYVYLYADKTELPAAFSVRTEEEITPFGIVDLLASGPWGGGLARLACSLAFGAPGNDVFPRGLALYLDKPDAPWAQEAAAWGASELWQLLWQQAERLLPFDPWEAFYFEVNAPWVPATPSLQTIRRLLQVTQGEVGSTRKWESTAGAFAAWVLDRYGRPGVEAFWRATSWEAGAWGLGVSPEELATQWEEFLASSLAQAEDLPLILAQRDAFEGRPSLALARLGGKSGAEVDYIRGLCYLALGEPKLALESLAAVPEAAPLLPVLRELAAAPTTELGKLMLVGIPTPEAEPLLAQADVALKNALSFWQLAGKSLPERIVFYCSQTTLGITPPWGVIWISGGGEKVSELTVKLVLEIVSPMGLPRFDTLVEGLTLCLAWPERDFRKEAQAVLESGRWVQITQSLFDAYPREIAEAEAGALVSYLIESYGEHAVREFWKSLVEGASPFRGTSEIFGIELHALDRALRDWVTQP